MKRREETPTRVNGNNEAPPGPPGPPGDGTLQPITQTSSNAVSAFPVSAFSEIDLICLSHLRWDFVYQRPQHLLSRCAKHRRVFFLEEPIFDSPTVRLEVSPREGKLAVVVPHLPQGLTPEQTEAAQRELLNQLVREQHIHDYLLWVYTPMALGYANELSPVACVYDCMDELALFRGAPPVLRQREQELFRRADLVFTGGQSLYEAKKLQHPRAYAFPSSIDLHHFAQGRMAPRDPADQRNIPHPRMGFYGVLDERFDLELLAAIAAIRPDWQFVMIGPVAKIDPEELPKRDNIHYLGAKTYRELPAYLGNWDVALLLFARNDSTRYISPTKTPEYLAAGKPVVSTSIRDVVRPYGEQNLVKIADEPQAFVDAIASCLAMNGDVAKRESIKRVDTFLATNSWDITWARMWRLIADVIAQRQTGIPETLSFAQRDAQVNAISAE